jgi:hypothetical protein
MLTGMNGLANTGVLLAEGPPPPRKPDKATRRSLLGGMLAGPLFTVAYLLEGAIKPDGYDPLRHPVSSLALGEFGGLQTASFIVAGVPSLAGAAGLRRALRAAPGPRRGARWGPLLLGIWAAQLVCMGIFRTDPVSGYPPGTPAAHEQYSGPAAALHDAIAMLGFVALAAACVVFAVRFVVRRRPGWAACSALSALGFLATMALAIAAFEQVEPLTAYGGLFQRIAITIAWCWQTLLAAHTLRALPDVPATSSD